MLYCEYRIYEVGGSIEETVWGLSQPRTLIEQNTIVIDSYEMFKETIKEMYGESIKFRRTKSMVDGDIYCVVVTKSTNENDFKKNQVHETTCEWCGKKFIYQQRYRPRDIVEVKHRDIDRYRTYDYCCIECRKKHHGKLYNEYLKLHDGINPNEYIDRGSYDWGCIYKITKKKSGEMYIGQTNSLPIFRWGQHLKSERFPVNDIENYKFEILEVVHDLTKLNEIESRYIKDYASKFPDLILNKTLVNK